MRMLKGFCKVAAKWEDSVDVLAKIKINDVDMKDEIVLAVSLQSLHLFFMTSITHLCAFFGISETSF